MVDFERVVKVVVVYGRVIQLSRFYDVSVFLVFILSRMIPAVTGKDRDTINLDIASGNLGSSCISLVDCAWPP